MALLKGLIDIPERVHKGDFVLRLSDGVQDPKATLRDYVVTEQLASCFDRAMLGEASRRVVQLIEALVSEGRL